MTASNSTVEISVVVPTCHRNEALALCLERLSPGVQSLARERYEVVITDDGSRSSAQAVVRERFPWARWVAGPRRGPAANRNRGAREARGQWLAFTDDDCLPEPGWLAAWADAASEPADETAETLETAPGRAQVLVPQAQVQAQVLEGRTMCSRGFRWPLQSAPVNMDGGALWSCNMAMERGLFWKMGGFDEGFPHASDEDTDFHRRLSQAKVPIRFVPGAVVDHPPVRRPWGRRTARLWESKVRLFYKHSDIGLAPHRATMLLAVFKIRLWQIRHSPPSLDWLLAALGLISELLYVSRDLDKWRRRHAGAASGHDSE